VVYVGSLQQCQAEHDLTFWLSSDRRFQSPIAHIELRPSWDSSLRPCIRLASFRAYSLLLLLLLLLLLTPTTTNY
jgi:hypothetical protein